MLSKRLAGGLFLLACCLVVWTFSPPFSTPGASTAPKEKRALNPNRHVVYVHGICPHDPGYSKDWWDAMKPHVDKVIPAENHHEVVWSDVIGLKDHPCRASRKDRLETAGRILETLQDRAERQRLENGADDDDPEGEPAKGEDSVLDYECAQDVTCYLLDDVIRQEVIARFQKVVRPLLEQGKEVEIISHSWGTVVSYEGLRRMDDDAGKLPGRVLNFFTAGSALSIPEVKRKLEERARDGKRPRVVDHWVNLDARFDIVGGRLKGKPFEVDEEHLHLKAVGCSPFVPNPACSHVSYFQKRNVAVNRDIFGRLICN